MWACCLTVIFAFLVCFVCSSFLTSHSFLHAGILSHALSFSHTLISLTFPSLCCHTLSHNIVLNPFHTLTLTFSFHFSALLLVVSPSLFLVHSLSGVLPLSCHLSLSSTHLSHAGSFSCNHAPTHHGLYPILFLSFLVATLSHTFAFLLAFLSMPSFVTPFLISLHLIFFGALSLSRAHSSSFPGSVSHCLLSTLSCASYCTHSLSIPLCSLFLRKTLLLIQYLCLMLSFLSSPTRIRGSSHLHTFPLSPLLPHLFLSFLHPLPALSAGSSLRSPFFLCSFSQQLCFSMCFTCMHPLPHALVILPAHSTLCALTLPHGPAVLSAHLLFLMCSPFLMPLSSIFLTQDFSFLLELFLTFFLFQALILTCSPSLSFSLSLGFTSYLSPSPPSLILDLFPTSFLLSFCILLVYFLTFFLSAPLLPLFLVLSFLSLFSSLILSLSHEFSFLLPCLH